MRRLVTNPKSFFNLRSCLIFLGWSFNKSFASFCAGVFYRKVSIWPSSRLQATINDSIPWKETCGNAIKSLSPSSPGTHIKIHRQLLERLFVVLCQLKNLWLFGAAGLSESMLIFVLWCLFMHSCAHSSTGCSSAWEPMSRSVNHTVCGTPFLIWWSCIPALNGSLSVYLVMDSSGINAKNLEWSTKFPDLKFGICCRPWVAPLTSRIIVEEEGLAVPLLRQ